MNELNLIPDSLKKNRGKKTVGRNMIYFAIIGLSLLFFGIYFPQLQLDNLTQQQSDIKGQVDSQSDILNKRRVELDYISSTNKLIGKVDGFKNNRELVYPIISGLQKLVPAEVVLTNLTYSKEGTMITATSRTYEGPAVFAANLQESKAYKNARLTNISLVGGSSYVFNVIIKNDGGVSK